MANYNWNVKMNLFKIKEYHTFEQCIYAIQLWKNAKMAEVSCALFTIDPGKQFTDP